MAVGIIVEPSALTNHISPDQARVAATEFLLDNVGNLLSVGEPHVMISAVRAMWIFPVQLAYLHTGVLGSVGVVAVDEETGQVIAWTPISEMKAASRRLRALHESENYPNNSRLPCPPIRPPPTSDSEFHYAYRSGRSLAFRPAYEWSWLLME